MLRSMVATAGFLVATLLPLAADGWGIRARAEAATPMTIVVGRQYSDGIAFSGQTNHYRVRLTAGSTYNLFARQPADYPTGYPSVRLRDAGGRLVPLAPGAEVTAKVTAIYQLDIRLEVDPETDRDGGGYIFSVLNDCAGNKYTKCSTQVPAKVYGVWDTYGDIDYRAVKLQAGKKYQVTVIPTKWDAQNYCGNLRVRNSNGVVVAGLPLAEYHFAGESFVISPRTSGTYFLAAALHDYCEYDNYSFSISIVR